MGLLVWKNDQNRRDRLTTPHVQSPLSQTYNHQNGISLLRTRNRSRETDPPPTSPSDPHTWGPSTAGIKASNRNCLQGPTIVGLLFQSSSVNQQAEHLTDKEGACACRFQSALKGGILVALKLEERVQPQFHTILRIESHSFPQGKRYPSSLLSFRLWVWIPIIQPIILTLIRQRIFLRRIRMPPMIHRMKRLILMK